MRDGLLGMTWGGGLGGEASAQAEEETGE